MVLSWTHAWGSAQQPPFGTSAEVLFRSDQAGQPGAVLFAPPPTSCVDPATGRTFFSRPEAQSCVQLDGVSLLAGSTYWVEAAVIGGDENFWLVRSQVKGSECWVDYEDMGGLMPGSALFGASADLNFCITGRPALGCLYDSGKTDVSNAFSNATVNVFSARRTLLDDSDCWTNYDDMGGLQSSSTVFGTPSDLNFCLDGELTPDVYCDPSHGSANNTSTIRASGSSLTGGVSIDLAGGPAGQSCYLLIGNGQGILHQPPGSKDDLCVVGGTCLGRYAADVGPIDGGGAFHTDLANSQSGCPGYGIPTCGGQIQSGETWNFQYWHRQPMGTPSTFSQALRVTFVN